MKNKIEIINLKKRFDEGRWISDELDLAIPEVKTTCVIGQSGEGKSVLLKQIIGLIHPDSGEVLVDGVNTTTLTRKKEKKILKNLVMFSNLQHF